MNAKKQLQLLQIQAEIAASREALTNHMNVLRADRVCMKIVENGNATIEEVGDKLFENQLIAEDESVIEKFSFLLSEEVASKEEAEKAKEFLKQLVVNHFEFNFHERTDNPGFDID